jgi:uncharacterized membrane protein
MSTPGEFERNIKDRHRTQMIQFYGELIREVQPISSLTASSVALYFLIGTGEPMPFSPIGLVLRGVLSGMYLLCQYNYWQQVSRVTRRVKILEELAHSAEDSTNSPLSCRVGTGEKEVRPNRIKKQEHGIRERLEEYISLLVAVAAFLMLLVQVGGPEPMSQVGLLLLTPFVLLSLYSLYFYWRYLRSIKRRIAFLEECTPPSGEEDRDVTG